MKKRRGRNSQQANGTDSEHQAVFVSPAANSESNKCSRQDQKKKRLMNSLFAQQRGRERYPGYKQRRNEQTMNRTRR